MIAAGVDAQRVWAAGMLFLAVSAPKNQLSKWRIKFAPEAPMEFAGEIT